MTVAASANDLLFSFLNVFGVDVLRKNYFLYHDEAENNVHNHCDNCYHIDRMIELHVFDLQEYIQQCFLCSKVECDVDVIHSAVLYVFFNAVTFSE